MANNPAVMAKQVKLATDEFTRVLRNCFDTVEQALRQNNEQNHGAESNHIMGATAA